MPRIPGEYTIGPAHLLKRLFGWTAELRSREHLQRHVVPAHLQNLIPLAERWGVTCDVTRHDVAAKASEQELKHFSEALDPQRDDIIDWLYSFEGVPQPHEAAVFQAMLILEAEECSGPGIPGYFTWAFRKHSASPEPETLRRLRAAYHFAAEHDLLRFESRERVAAAQKALAQPNEGT